MFEATGSLAIVDPTLLLFGLVAVPLFWALLAAADARPREERATLGVAVAALGSLLTFALAVTLAVRLALLPAGHVLVQHVAQLARLGQLDLAFDLALDARSATFVVVVASTSFASVLFTLGRRRRRSEELAWTGLLTTGAMLLCVSDGVPPILVGLGTLSLGAWGLFRGRDARATSVTAAGNIAILLGFIFLFWSLGGVFGPEGYDPDGAPRFVLVTTDTPSEAPEKASLAMTSHAGALVSADDGDLPNEPVVSPLSILVSPGLYTLRVQRGVASGDVVVPRVALVAGKTHVLTPYGPTTSLRALDDQLAVPRATPTGTTANVRTILAGRTVGGLRASAVVLLLVLGGALGHVYAFASRRGASALASVLETLPAPYLALRLAPLVDPSGADGSLVILLGVGSAFVLATRAACLAEPHAALRGVLSATAAVGVAAAGLREPSSIVVLVASSVIAASAALAATETRHDDRWLGVACAAAVGLLPGAGASMGFVLAITAALGSAATGSAGWAAFSGTIALVLAATVAFGSLAAYRVYDAINRAQPAKDVTRLRRGVVVVLAVLGVGAGIFLGTGTSVFGGHVAPFVQRLTGPTTVVGTRVMAGAAVVLTVVAAASGLFLARTTRVDAPPAWLRAIGRPHAVLSWTTNGIAEGAAFLHRSVEAMEREVVEYVPSLIATTVERVVGMFGKASDAAARRIDEPLGHAADVVMVKLEMDEPRRAERVHTAIVLVMVALLGSIVLSSVLLR